MKIITIHTNKFKSRAISIVLPLPLNEKTTDYNLIASIIKRGCLKYPSSKEICKHLEELYGAVFEIIITKKGEKLLINFYIQFIDNKYALYNEDILNEVIKFLYEIIYNTIIENEEFKNEYFIQEKENLKTLINSRIDNKDEYVIERAAELCTEGEPYEIFEHGDITLLNSIENKKLASLWLDTINSYELFMVSCGNMDKNILEDLVNKYFDKKNTKQVSEDIIISKKYIFKEKFEKLKVNQGKICLCYRTNINIKNGDYYALSVMNSIIGGGTHSKLFKEVREKNSLAYYIYSFVEKYKGLLFVTAGIEFESYDNVKKIITDQIISISIGDISDCEIENSKKKIISDLKSAADSQIGIMDYVSSLRAYDVNDDISNVICGIENVSKDRIIKASENLFLGSSYFLINN
ncbi:MAG: insulinase family protein [Bacillota bacterium]|nr:insulinase family protein [Bacillota bacterium]